MSNKLAVMQKITEDPRVFFKFLKVFDKERGELVPFTMNNEQEELLEALLTILNRSTA